MDKLYHINVKLERNSNIPNLIDIFNAHPCIDWEVNRKMNNETKQSRIFTFFNQVSYIQALRICKLIK